MARTRKNPTYTELLKAVQTLPLRAQFIEVEGTPSTDMVYGICEIEGRAKPQITLNEPALLVSTLIHEATHALREGWAEQTVDQRSLNLYAKLSNAQIRRLYDHYRRRVKRERGKVVL